MKLKCTVSGGYVEAEGQLAKMLVASGSFIEAQPDKPAPKKRAAQKKAPAKEQ